MLFRNHACAHGWGVYIGFDDPGSVPISLEKWFIFEKACAVSGYLLGVNPFDQPV